MADFSKFPAYDEVHVISDIHMGGKPGFQILRETKRLAGYIRWVAKQSPNGKVALVLNGDVFDTLAEDIPGYVAVDEAVSTVQRIMNDPSFSGIWDALAEFVKTERRMLIFVIGNHDIEIAFPTVQNLIQWRLAGDNLNQRARIVFSTTGGGYTCTVGGASVYCTHGNEVDAWNYNRYEDLAKVCRRINAGLSLSRDEWTPNAGTRMVIEVMNKVKQNYRWVDLLKPEGKAAASTLFVLEPGLAAKLPDLISIVGDKAKGSRQIDQRLSADGFLSKGESSSEEQPITLDQVLGENLRDYVQSRSSVDDMLRDAERNLGKRDKLIAEANSQLGIGQYIWDRLTGVKKEEALRKALQDWLKDDETFKIENKDETYQAVTATVGHGIDFIITGHTHLERAIPIGPNRFYFNCGTWIRLLRFTDAMLRDWENFKPVYDVIVDQKGNMNLIDEQSFPDGLGKKVPFVLDQTGAVAIKTHQGRVVGQLTHIEGDGSGAPKVIKEFTRR